MDSKAESTPFDQKLFLVFMATFASMTAFEFAGVFLYPFQPDWRSNLILSFFVSGLAVIVSYFPLRSYYAKNLEVLQEIGKCHVVERELRESEKKYRLLADNATDIIWVLDLVTQRFTYFSPSVRAIRGYTPEEACDLPPEKTFTPESYARALDELSTSLEQDNNNQVEYDRIRVFEFEEYCRDGSVISTENRIKFIRNPNGVPIALQGSTRDITERKRVEAALKKSENVFRQLVGELPDYVIIHEGETIVFVNSGGAHLIGKTPEEIVGTSVLSYAAPEYHDLIKKNIALRCSGASVAPYDIEIITPSEERRWVVTRATLLHSWERPAILTVMTDITERKQAEEALRQANRNLSLLSGITRHDINNQLQALNGFIELLQLKMPHPVVEDYYTRIMEASNQITSMIRFTKEYEEIGVRAAAWQDLRVLVDSAANGLLMDTIELRNDLPAGLNVYSDPLIVKVFFNLIENAQRHGGNISRIRFSFEECNGNGIIVCEDNGTGIPGDEKERIFIRGFGKNTGFGLAISRDILDITGITIRECGMPGKGARFEIIVPKKAYQIDGTQKNVVPGTP